MDNPPYPPSPPICLGKIVGVQGLKGAVRIKTYTEEPCRLTAYGNLVDETQQPLTVKITQVKSPNLVIATVKGCFDRNQAEALVGTKLYIARKHLSSLSEDEYYYHDLICMTVLDEQSSVIGEVKNIENYGAGDFLEIIHEEKKIYTLPFNKEEKKIYTLPFNKEEKKIYTLPFNKEAVLSVDLTNRKIYIQRRFLLF